MRFLSPEQHPDQATEKAQYDLHENDPLDPGYRAFLSRLADPLIPLLKPGMRGLDFGCGPGPALARMLTERGFEMAVYDPYYANRPAMLEPPYAPYDFVTCTETAEHFHSPRNAFQTLARIVRSGSYLAIMTCFQTDDGRFANWHYRKDPTHVSFYREATLEWVASHYGWSLDIPRKDVAIFRC